VVAAGFDALGRQEGVDLVAPRIVVGPLAHGVEHVFVDLDVLVTDGGVVEGAEDVVDDFVDGNAGIFPSVEDAAG
jgi:molybdopterin biosynthesis enzyme